MRSRLASGRDYGNWLWSAALVRRISGMISGLKSALVAGVVIMLF